MPDRRVRTLPRAGVELWLDLDDDAGWAYTSGTSFPPVPRLGERYFRTDIRGGMLFIWNGVYWLSEQQFTQSGGREDNLTMTNVIVRVPMPQDLDIYLIRVDSAFYFSLNDGSNKWLIDQKYVNSGGAGTIIKTDDTTVRAPAGGGWKKWNDTYSLLISGAFAWECYATKTGSPTLYGGHLFTYRLRAV